MTYFVILCGGFVGSQVAAIILVSTINVTDRIYGIEMDRNDDIGTIKIIPNL